MSYEIVARPHQQNFINWAKDKPNVLVLSADLTNSCEVGKWRDTYPDRFFSMGMAEQNMLGYAAGLAREGFELRQYGVEVAVHGRCSCLAIALFEGCHHSLMFCQRQLQPPSGVEQPAHAVEPKPRGFRGIADPLIAQLVL